MPGCVAVSCSNSAKKGFAMKRFPRDLKRRKEWLIKMRRDNWSPTDYSRICEVHFAPEMWEQNRADGMKKLRPDAVPTVFHFTVTKHKRKFPIQRDPIIKRPRLMESGSSSSSTSNETANDITPQNEPTKPAIANSVMLITNDAENSRFTSVSFDSKKILGRYDKIYAKNVSQLENCKKLLRNSKLKCKRLEDKVNENTSPGLNFVSKVFNQDQIAALQRKQNNKTNKFVTWSDDTIIKALKLKFAGGNSGYEEVLKQNLPYPSARTLQRRLQNLKFDSGILDEVFKFLKVKIQCLNEHEKDCALILDEMAITPGVMYDTSLNKYFGNVTLPNHDGIATHVLVFLLAGVNTRWKQIVGYYFTSNSVNGAVFEEIIAKIFEKCYDIDLNILSITSDMGSCNQALWRKLDITAGRHKLTKNTFENPIPQSTNRNICVFADVPHLFKNMKAMLVSNKIIRIPDFIKSKYNLPTNEICVDHIFDLINYQKELEFQLAPKLTEEDLLPSHYDKMKVTKSGNVINHDVSSALKFIAEHLNKPQYLTTAWFIDQVEKWFYLMTSRSPANALSQFNNVQYESAISFLTAFMEIIKSIEVGANKQWKPSQTGVLISTKSILDLQKILLEDKKYEFVLTSRFSQDCLENLFSILRSKQIVPNALQVKNNLKLICVSQYLRTPKNTSYAEDDGDFFSDFLSVIKESKPMYDTVQLPKNINSTFVLNYSEINSLYNICGYIVNSIKVKSKTCNTCIECLGSTQPIFTSFSRYTSLKCYKIKTLFFCNEITFYYFVELESVFRKYYNHVFTQNINLKDFFEEEMQKIDFTIPNCHFLKCKLISRFAVFRLKIASKKYNKNINKYASKSMALASK